MYDIVIIGAGLSSLYFTNKLRNKNYIILEKKGIIGGRIKTRSLENNDKTLHYELGAQRIHESHERIFNLIHKLKLEHKIKKIKKKKDYIFINNNKSCKLNNLVTKKFKNEITNILKKNNNYNNDTFYSIAEKYLSKEEINDLINYYGYNIVLKTMNYNNFKQNYYEKNNNYYYLEDGLSQIVKKLAINLNMKLSTIISEIKKEKNYYVIKTNNGIYKTKKIVFGIPKENLLQFNILKKYKNILNSVSTNNFIRVYALFDKNDNYYWYDDINTTYSNTRIRKIIKDHNSKHGLIQICYNDGIDASNIKNNIINGTLEKEIMKNLYELFPQLFIPKPKKLYYQYWHAGTHYYLPTYNINDVYNKILNPCENIYIMGECYSHHQGWMEGALETADDVLKILNKRPKIKLEKIIKRKEFKEKGLINNWTIYNHYVYDLTDFINNHPGGEVIKYALGKDMTNIFNGVGHSNQAYYLLEKYKIGKLI